MADQVPDSIWLYMCTVPPTNQSPFPTGCEIRGPYSSSFLEQPYVTSKESYDALFGAILMIVSMVIAISLIKKAIEQ
jgi:hypothetical protein